MVHQRGDILGGNRNSHSAVAFTWIKTRATVVRRAISVAIDARSTVSHTPTSGAMRRTLLLCR